MFFHRHNWVEVERFYTPPLSSYKDGDVIKIINPRNPAMQLAHGLTNIHYQCSTCRKHKWKEVLGKEIKK